MFNAPANTAERGARPEIGARKTIVVTCCTNRMVFPPSPAKRKPRPGLLFATTLAEMAMVLFYTMNSRSYSTDFANLITRRNSR